MPTYRVGKSFLDDIYGTRTISSPRPINYGLEVTKADPIIDAATVSMVKDYYNINTDDYDDQIVRNLRTSLITIENYTNRNIVTRQVTARWKVHPNVVILPNAPIVSITSVKAIDEDGTEETLTLNTDYYSYGDKEIDLEVVLGNYPSLEVIYEAGYGKGLDDIPTWAQDAVIYQLGIYYSNFDESMGTRVYDANSGLDQRAKSACDGNRYLRGN